VIGSSDTPSSSAYFRNLMRMFLRGADRSSQNSLDPDFTPTAPPLHASQRHQRYR